MRWDGTQTEGNVDLRALFASALRKWAWFFGAVLIGALLFGLYRGVLNPGKAAGETRIEEMQETVEASETSLKTNANDIAACERNIAANNEKIASHEKIIANYESSLKEMRETLATLKKTLAEAERALSDESLSAAARVELIGQISAVEGDIINVNGRIDEAVRMTNTLHEETMTWRNDIESNTVRIGTLKDAREKLQKTLDEQRAELEEMSGRPGKKSVLLTAAIGGVLGGFLFCGVVFVQFLTDKKLRGAKEYGMRYGVYVLGQLRSAKAQSRKGKFSRALDAFAGDIETAESEDKVFELVAAALRARTDKKTVAVTGTLAADELSAVADRLGAFMPEGYDVKSFPNPVYNAGLLSELEGRAVLLTEAKGVSDRRETDKLAGLLTVCGADVVGAMLK